MELSIHGQRCRPSPQQADSTTHITCTATINLPSADFTESMRALGYPRSVSMDNFRSPNFQLVADALFWMVKRYDPDIGVSDNIESENDRVDFLTGVAAVSAGSWGGCCFSFHGVMFMVVVVCGYFHRHLCVLLFLSPKICDRRNRWLLWCAVRVGLVVGALLSNACHQTLVFQPTQHTSSCSCCCGCT